MYPFPARWSGKVIDLMLRLIQNGKVQFLGEYAKEFEEISQEYGVIGMMSEVSKKYHYDVYTTPCLRKEFVSNEGEFTN
jgi:hypothetical protein